MRDLLVGFQDQVIVGLAASLERENETSEAS
jgi:hypothetical protein